MNDADNNNDNSPSPPAASSTSATAAAAASSSQTTINEHLALTIQTLDQLTTIFQFPHHLSKIAIDTCGPEDVTACYNYILDNYSNEVSDCGGPVVPKKDCPHVDTHVKFVVKDGRMQIVNNGIDNDDNNSGAEGGGEVNTCCQEFQRLCLKGNLMTSKCQHYNECHVLRRRVSRKRLRSEDNVVIDDSKIGRLKCEEDYEINDEKEGDTKKSNNQPPSCPAGENWLCLECGALLCSRYANGHAKVHYEDTKEEGKAYDDATMAMGGSMLSSANAKAAAAEEGHCIAVSLADLSAWCYECNAYLHHPKLNVLTKHLEGVKFGKKEEDGGDTKNDDEEMQKKKSDEEKQEIGNDTSDDMKVEDGISSASEQKPSNNAAFAASRPSIKSAVAARLQSINDKSAQKPPPSVNKRKSQPRRLPPEQLTTITTIGESMGGGGSGGGDTDVKDTSKSNGDSSRDDSSEEVDDIDSSEEEEGDEAAIIATLLQSEHGDALRAYLQRYESFDTSNMGQCVPMHMPKPPQFPDEMADFLRSPLCKSIIVLAGAGMSVSSGIPDFRSAGVGLYDTLRPELLTASELEQALIEDDPTLALDKGMFLENPLPMLETKRSFILGVQEKRWKATLAHRFVEMLHTKLGKLTRLYTQNIDGLELQTNLPREKVVPVHGSMGAAACEQCGHEVDFDEFCNDVRTNIKDITGEDVDAPAQSTPIVCEACQNPTVKPTIVLFRGSMPTEFHTRTAEDLPDCDLLIVMGTSLTVAPANTLVYRIPPTALRMVMNNERVGRRLGIDYSEESVRDVWAHGYTDETCLNLAEKMGWLDDLAEIVDELPDSSATLLRERLAQRQENEGNDAE